MKCEDVESRLNAYFDGELAELMARQVELHLTDCDSCHAKLQKIEITSRALNSIDTPEIPADFAQKVIGRAKSRPFARNFTSDSVFVRLAASLMLLLGVGLGSFMGFQVSQSLDPEVIQLAVHEEDELLRETGEIYFLSDAAAISDIYFEAEDSQGRVD